MCLQFTVGYVCLESKLQNQVHSLGSYSTYCICFCQSTSTFGQSQRHNTVATTEPNWGLGRAAVTIDALHAISQGLVPERLVFCFAKNCMKKKTVNH